MILNTKSLSRIQNVLDEMVNTGYAAGGNCLVLQNGIEQCYYESGYRDLDSKDKLTRDTLFRLYSMSKTVTSVATFILIERGVIDLFDNVSKYLPGFANPKVATPDGSLRPASREIRISDLLSMTSGLPYPNNTNLSEIAADELMTKIISQMDTSDALSTIEIANLTGANPLAFDPGSKWQYGFSADILGAVIEVASGMKFSDFLSENIFNPLGMKDTGFYVPSDKLCRLSKVYQPGENGLKLYTYSNLGISNTMTTKPLFESGGAGLCSCIDDFVPFTQMLLNNGTYKDIQILSPESVKYISNAHLPSDFNKYFHHDMPHMCGYSYGNLMRVMTDAPTAASLGCNGEFGWDGWLGAYMAIDPANKLTILFMMQLTDSGTNEYTRKLRNVIYSAL